MASGKTESKSTFGTPQTLTNGTEYTCETDGYLQISCSYAKSSYCYAYIGNADDNVSSGGHKIFIAAVSTSASASNGMVGSPTNAVFLRKGMKYVVW